MLSAEGQESVAKDGYFPVTHELAQAELAKIQ